MEISLSDLRKDIDALLEVRNKLGDLKNDHLDVVLK